MRSRITGVLTVFRGRVAIPWRSRYCAEGVHTIMIQPIIDCHSHIITSRVYPRELFVGRFTVPKVLVSALCDAVEEGRDLCWPLRLAWKFMPGKLQRFELLVRLYDGTMEKQAAYLRQEAQKAGVKQMWILGLDIPDVGEYGPVHDRPALVAQLQVLSGLGDASDGFFVPFYPFDPRREDAVTTLIAWLAGGKFKGVKMYSALGFNVEGAVDPKMAWHRNLREGFEVLQEQQTPIVVHGSGGGIRGPEVHAGDMKWLSSPERWAPVLKVFPKLKVCFAHGTGEAGFLTLSDPKKGTWAWHLRDLLLRYPGVYTDISFHEGVVKASAAYRKKIEKVVHDAVRRKLLFGSDAPLHFGEYGYGHLISAARDAVPGVDTLMASNAREFLTVRV